MKIKGARAVVTGASRGLGVAPHPVEKISDTLRKILYE
jgi:hypothetical protein